MSQRFIDGLLLRDSGTGPGTQSSPRGPIGPDGEPGEDGLRGPPGPAGPTGATGDPGDPGASGTTGPTGATGSRGPIGSDGIDGEDGLRGPAGPAGIAGAAGMRGMAGEDGDEGPMGPVAQIATVTQPSEMSSTQFWHCRGGFGEWTTTASGAGAGSYTGATDHIGPTLNADGQWGMQTGTTATGYCSIYHAPFCAFGGGTVYEFACRLTVGSLSTAAEEYAFTAGFGDAFATTGEPVDGAYFIYRRATDGDFWVCCTRSNSTETKTVTAVAPTTYSGQTKLRTEVSGDGARVQFWIAGVLVATHTSNIPTGSSRLTGMGLKFEKSAGTTSRFAYADWISLRSTRSAST